MWKDNLKISTRLVLGFGSMVVLMVIMTAITIALSTRADDQFHVVTGELMPKIDLLHKTKEQIFATELALTHVVLDFNPENVKRQQAVVEAGRQKITRAFEELARLVVHDKGRAMLQDILKARALYAGHLGELFAKAQAGEMDAARSVLIEKMPEHRAAYFNSLDRLIDFQTELTQQSQKASADAIDDIRIDTLTALAVALVAAVVTTYLLLRAITGPLHRAVDLARAVAAGDLSHTIETRGTNEMSQLLRALADMQTSLAQVVHKVRTGSDSVATASAEIAQGNHDLSSRTESQASALQETAASMEQLNSTVRQNADNARQANQLAQSASTVATQGGQVVADVVRTMKEINESSRRISDIIGVIDGIAFQTNILALNAAVEAARAGEQGRGFAVVASEVRSLAGRSAEAAREIKGLIGASVERVETGSALVDRAGQTMAEVVGAIQRVTDIMGEISAASTEQSQGVAQVGEAVTQMDQVTQQNAALVEEMAAAAASLNTQAQDLVDTVAVFKLGAGMAPYGTAQYTPAASTPPVAKPAPAATTRLASTKPATMTRPAAKLTAPAASKTTPVKAADAGAEWESF